MTFGIHLKTDEIVSNGMLVANEGRHRFIDYNLADLSASPTELMTGQEARGHARRSNEVYCFPGGRAGLKIGDENADIEHGVVFIPKGDPHRVPNLAEGQEFRFVPVFHGG